MKTENKIIILALLTMNVSLLSVLLTIDILNNAQENVAGIKVNELAPLKIELNNELSKVEKIEQIAQAVYNEREYKLNVYDCTQFSDRLRRELNQVGINAYCQAGWYSKEYTPHTWVEINDPELGIIEVEATAGIIVDKETFKREYVKAGGLKRVCW